MNGTAMTNNQQPTSGTKQAACLCQGCGKKHTRHPLGLCVACFKQFFGFASPYERVWDWDDD